MKTENWTICLVCLEEGRRLRSINEKDNNDEETNSITIKEKIKQCSGIEIESNMELPEEICRTCLDNLQIAYKFRITCRSSYDTLMNISDENGGNVIPVAGTGRKVGGEDGADGNFGIKEPASSSDVNENGSDDEIDGLDINLLEPTVEVKDVQSDDDDDIDDDDAAGIPEYNYQQQQQHQSYSNSPLRTKIQQVIQEKINYSDEPIVIDLDDDDGIAENSTSRTHQCSRCNEILPTFVHLQTHYRLKHLDKPFFKCEHCPKQFRNPLKKLRHEKKFHSYDRPFKCEDCGSSFKHPWVLKDHKRIHTAYRPYECKPCEKKFLKCSNWKQHLATHKHKAVIESLARGQVLNHHH